MFNARFQIFALIFVPSALAVSPLVTDDADTVEPQKLQVNAGGLFTKTAGEQLVAFPVNLITGVSSHGEIGATFGYQWRDGNGSAPDKSGASGSTDLFLGTKWQLWRTSDDAFKLSARLDLKLPVASRTRGFGSGDVDSGVVLIGTRSWGPTALDWNLGYVAVDLSHGVTADDHWFVGQAVRHELNEHWTIIGEVLGVFPQSGRGGSANFFFNAGAQYNVRKNFLISALLGSAAGHHSPDLTGYLGCTLVY
jgi:hypothetical protein